MSEDLNAFGVAVATVACTFGGTLAGFWIRKRLPSQHLSAESHDIVKLGAGTVATLSALVLGLLVTTAKGVLDRMNEVITQASANLVLLDRELARFGPDSRDVRESLRQSLAESLQETAPQIGPSAAGFSKFEWSNQFEAVVESIDRLTPKDELQRQALAHAQSVAFNLLQARWNLVAQSQHGLPEPLIVVLVFWLALLFVTFGLFAPANGTVVAILFLSACSAAAAIFLVIEMNQPIDGMIHVSFEPVRNAYAHLGR